MNIAAVLERIRPGEKWELHGFEYEGLIWQDTTQKPTLDEIEAAWPEVERDHKMAELRERRDLLLAACDWTQIPDATVDKLAWAEYRQKLRDLPQTTTDPDGVTWPEPPA